MKKERLSEICKIQYGFPFDSALFSEKKKGMPLVRIRDVVRGFSETYTTEAFGNEYIVNDCDLLVGMDGEFNISKWRGGQALLNQRVCKLIPYDNVDATYLFYYLPRVLKDIEARTPFATVKHLSAKQLNSITIMLPELERQRRIACILEKVDRLISLREGQISWLDNIVKSRFMEMFGDSNYPRSALIDLVIEGAGLSYGIVQPGNDGTGDMGVLRPIDMVEGKISMESIKYIDRTIGDGFKKTELNGDELLITVRGTTGFTALTDARFRGMNVTRGIAVIRYARNKINPVYLDAYLNSEESQRYIQEHTRGATLQQINLSDLRIQQIMVPPMELQEQFAAFVAQTDKSKYTHNIAERKWNNLKTIITETTNTNTKARDISWQSEQKNICEA